MLVTEKSICTCTKKFILIIHGLRLIIVMITRQRVHLGTLMYSYMYAINKEAKESSSYHRTTRIFTWMCRAHQLAKRIMVMTKTACRIKIIHIYHGYLNLLGFEHSSSLLSPFYSSIYIVLVSLVVPLFSRFLVIL